jgi:hypothetical protein
VRRRLGSSFLDRLECDTMKVCDHCGESKAVRDVSLGAGQHVNGLDRETRITFGRPDVNACEDCLKEYLAVDQKLIRDFFPFKFATRVAIAESTAAADDPEKANRISS